METILMSIHPKWCEKIFNGEKTIEVRKTAPKPPFKVVVYCTKGKPNLYIPQEYNCFTMDEASQPYFAEEPILQECDNLANGKVIGEFICDDIYEIKPDAECYFSYGYDIDDDTLDETCLTQETLKEYGKGRTLYGLHISRLKIYDKPRELGELKHLACDKQESHCDNCKHKYNVGNYEYREYECGRDEPYPITRPPQSYMRIQDIN